MGRHKLLTMLSAGLLLVLLGAVPARAEIVFDDAGDPMTLANDGDYEVGFSMTHGGIVYIQDKTTGGTPCIGNAQDDLWRIRFDDAGLIRSSSFAAKTAESDFSYSWDAQAELLSLRYELQDGASLLVMTVDFAANDAGYVDITGNVENNYGDTILDVYLPGMLAFDPYAVEQFYYPYYEGVAFQRDFFLELRSVQQTYQHLFTDFAALESSEGNWAIYAIPGADFSPASLGLRYSSWGEGVGIYEHIFRTSIASGTTWTSAPLRLRVGLPILETLAAFRIDRGIDEIATVIEKTGKDFEKLSEALLVKIDCQHVHDWGWAAPGETFAWVDSVAALLPRSSMLHLVSFWPGGFDNNYPDYIPPNEGYGDLLDFLGIFTNAHSRGQVVMPYTNPTWWDDESPTLDSLGTDIAACDRDGSPIYECYGANCGYVICPAHRAVIARQAATVDEFTKAFEADILFEDQVADRPWTYDANPAEASQTDYTDALIRNAATSAQSIPLATEGMLDVLLAIELGFYDSVMLDKKAGWIESWGEENWVTFPLTMLVAHDKVIFGQHNLAVEVMTHNKEMLAYNLAYGFGLNFDLTGQSGMLENKWLAIAEAFQREAAARCCGKRMTDFEFLDANQTVTRSVFEDIEVVGNHGTGTYDWGDYQIAPQGCYAAADDGSLIAGVFTRFNGNDLDGEHFIVQHKATPYRILVEQPFGEEALLRVDRPGDWDDDARLRVVAVCEGMRVDVTAAATTEIMPSYIQFLWQEEVANQSVRLFRLTYKPAGTGEPPAGTEDENVTGIEFALLPSQPNPFHGHTSIVYALPQREHVSLRVHDLNGRLVRTLVDKPQDPKLHVVSWDGRNDRGRAVESGIYMIRYQAGEAELTRRSILLR